MVVLYFDFPSPVARITLRNRRIQWRSVSPCGLPSVSGSGDSCGPKNTTTSLYVRSPGRHDGRRGLMTTVLSLSPGGRRLLALAGEPTLLRRCRCLWRDSDFSNGSVVKLLHVAGNLTEQPNLFPQTDVLGVTQFVIENSADDNDDDRCPYEPDAFSGNPRCGLCVISRLDGTGQGEFRVCTD